MTKSWNDELLAAYLAHGARDRAHADESGLEWAFGRVNDIIREAPPAEALQLALDLVQRTPDDDLDDRLLAYVAAGPVEDVLCKHGAAVLEPLLAAADRDARVRTALAYTWGWNGMDSAVWQRLQAAIAGWQVQP
jgi:hypothetical protein